MDGTGNEDLGSGEDAPLTPQRLLEVWYERLKAIAAQYVARIGRSDITRTGVAHEAAAKWLLHPPQFTDDQHVLSLLHRHVTQVVMDRLRSDGAKKRGGDWVRIPLRETLFGVEPTGQGIDLERFESALEDLGRQHGRRLQEVLLLRTVGELTIDETARTLRVSTASIERDFRFACAWMRKRLME